MSMNKNADFSKHVVVNSTELDWLASPAVGVERRVLDRVGGEVARATSVVRYAPGSQFPAHLHPGGEEFIVLTGTFQDEHGDYPQGSYVRNPPNSQHTPGSVEGCVIFVKLWQFQPDAKQFVNTDIFRQLISQNERRGKVEPSVEQHIVFEDSVEQVIALKLSANTVYKADAPSGAELFILKGDIDYEGENLEQYCWVRLPVNSKLNLMSGKQGAVIWIKYHHLADIDNQLRRLPS